MFSSSRAGNKFGIIRASNRRLQLLLQGNRNIRNANRILATNPEIQGTGVGTGGGVWTRGLTGLATCNNTLIEQKQQLRENNNVLGKRNLHNSRFGDKQPQAAENSLMQEREIINLSNYGITESMVLDLEIENAIVEQISVMKACLAGGNVDRARRMVVGMYNLHPEKVRQMLDVNVHNVLIKGLLEAEPSREREALGWYGKMQKEYGITPNYNTFALLIKGYMRSRLDNVVKLLVEEFEKQGNKVEQLVLSPYLSDEEFDRLESITSGKFKNRMGVLNDIALETFLDQGSNNTNELQELKEAEQSVRKEQERMNIGNMNEKQNDTATHNKDGLLKDAESDTLGIKMLKRMLNPLEEGELTDYEKQLRLEHEANEASAHRYEVETSSYRDGELQKRRPAIQKYVSEWIPQVVEQIEAELALCKDEGLMLTPEDRERAVYAPFLRLLPPEQIANITIMETFRMVMARSNVRDNMIPDGSAKMTRVIMTLGTALRTQYHMMELQKKKNSHLLQRGLDLQGLSVSGKLFNMAVRKAQSKVEAGLAKSDWVGEWPRATTVKLGAMLVGILLKVAKIEVTELNEETGQTERKKVPAFEHSFWLSNGYRHGIIKMHLELTSIMARSSYTRILSARHLPMIVPPKPWLSYNIGGYLSFSSLCMRIHNNVEHQKYIKHLSEQGKLGTVLAGLDVLGLTKWAINKRVFTVVRDVWNSGKSLADIPPLELTESEPQRKFAVDVIPAEKFATLSEEQKTTEQQRLDAQYRQAVTDYRRKKANNHSLRCDVNYKVEIAQAFLDRPMYFPHNFDFRGRAYPLPPFFNQMGNDLCRGLITFYDGKKLGARGMFWLKVHLANTYGFDKFSHTDRVKFCDDNWDNIRDSALHPLDGNRWWLASEDPWQTLAACIELVDAVDSGDPENFVSHLHVHQDGTCNGLQHYAALGRDFEGGRQVNLVPGDHPMDVYSAVLDVVEVSVRRDAANGHEMAQLLVGKLKRKVIKQTVMTNVYGVSMYGAREQVMARLKEIVDPQTGAPLFTDRGQLLKLATYLAHRVFESLGEIFECARQIQDWLNEAASRIARSLPPESVKLRKELARLRAKQLRLAHSTIKTKTKVKAKTESTDETNTKSVDQANNNTKSTDETETETKTKAKSTTRPDLSDIDSSKVKTSLQQRKKHLIDQISSQPLASVTWTTPLNLIIVQPYRKLVTKAISSSLQYVSLVNEDLPSPVNSQKQKTAFPPNFVHSLDASHMLLSAIQCKVNGIVFSSVHDSYWTHACDIDMMNNILREQFVALHQKNILTELRDEFMLRYKDYLIPVNTTKVSQNHTSNLTSKSKHDYSLDYDHNADKIKLTSKISYIPFDLPPLPPTGTLDINSVLDSKYFFS